MVFLHVILSYLTASIFRDPMLNCFWTECCSFCFAVTPFGSVSNASLGTRLRNCCQLSLFTVFKISVNEKFGYENFRTKSLSEIKLVRNVSFLMYNTMEK